MSQKERAQRLRAAFRSHPDRRDALRAFTGHSIAEVARRAGAGRRNVDQMIAGRRTAAHIRRAVEVAYGLPPYALDEVLNQHIAEEE